MTGMAVTEIPFTRETFGGDGHAINRHSVRYYVKSDGTEFVLDRTLDGAPPFFALWAITASHRQASRLRPLLYRIVPRNGAEYWGDGWTWARAEKAALRLMRDFVGE